MGVKKTGSLFDIWTVRVDIRPVQCLPYYLFIYCAELDLMAVYGYRMIMFISFDHIFYMLDILKN